MVLTDKGVELKTILDHIDDAVLIVDRKGEILYFNKAAITIFGFSAQVKKLEWLEYFELFKRDNKTKIERINSPVFKFLKGERITEIQYYLYPKSKPTKKISLSISYNDSEKSNVLLIVKNLTQQDSMETRLIQQSKSLTSAYEGLRRAEAGLKVSNTELEKKVNERTAKLSKINFDLKKEISSRVNAEDKLKQKNHELTKINTDLDNFIYTASHDLRAPISNLEGLITALKDTLENGKKEDEEFIFGLIDRSVEKFKQTIADLTEISKVQKGMEEDVEEVAFADVLNDTIITMQDIIKNCKCIIQSDFKIKTIKFSVKNLRSVFYNLVSNAIKYRSEERIPELVISSRLEGGKILLSFKDNGLGISTVHQDKIFKMFKRAHNHVEGSGIGLYIVKRIVENAEGSIEVVSKENEGTSFMIYLKQ